MTDRADPTGAGPEPGSAERPRVSMRRDLRLLALLGVLGGAVSYFSVNIPHTEVFIEVRMAFLLMGAALLGRWWAVGLLLIFLSLTGFHKVGWWVYLPANLASFLPFVVVVRWVYHRWLSKWSHPLAFGAGWSALVLALYQVVSTPVIWAARGLLADRPVGQMILEGWQEQPLLVESLLVAMISASGLLVLRSQARLRRSRRELATTLDSIGDAVIATDEQGRVTRMNPVAEELTGWSLEEARGRPLEDVFHIISALTGETAESPVDKVIREGTVVGLANHTSLVRRDGSQRQIADSAAPIHDNRGRLTGVVMVFRDVSEEYRSRDALRRSEQHQRALVDASPLAIVSIDRAGRVLTWNEAAERVFGWSADEVVGRPLPTVPPAAEGASRQFWQRVFDGERVSGERLTRRRKDGSQVEVSLSAAPMRDEHGEVQAIVGVLEDLTEQRQAQAQLALQGMVLDQIQDRVTVTDLDGRITYVNDAVAEMLQRPKDQLIDQPVSVFGGEEEDKATQEQIVEQTRRDGSWRGEVVNMTADGGRRILDCRTQMVRDGEGRPVAMCGISTDITERRQAEEAFARLCNLATELICVADIHSATFTQVNPAFERQLGWSEQELLSRPFLEFVHPDDLEATQRVIREDLQAGKRIISFQNRYRCKDGSYRWLDWNSHPIVEEGLTFAIAHDITDRVQVEAALRESEHRFRSFVENANDIVYAVDFDGVFTYISPNWLELMGEPASEAIGKSFRPYVHPDDVHLCEEFLARVLREGRRERSVEYRVRTADGRLRWHVSSGSPLRNDAGEVVSYMGIARDTTEVKRVQQAMRESETRYRTLAENFPDGVLFLIDREFRYLAADGRALETSGLADEQIVGRTVWEVFPDLWPEMREHHEAVFRGQEVYYEVEFGGRLYSNQSLPVRDEQGEVVRAIMVTQDITDKKQAERDREHLQAQLMQSQKLEAVGRLAGGVAHDFNNKLQTILGCADMLLSDAADAETDDETGEYLRIIRDSARQSADLTRQLLAFARKQTISPKVLDLNKTIGGMLKMLRRLIGEDIELSWLPADEVCNVRMDPVQVDQILANLVVNARDAITGVGKITIETGSAEFDEDYCRDHADFLPGRYAMLAVSDDGVGMDEETVQRAFEPFYTTKSQDQGTGLGLATVYGILRQNEGFVNIYSEPGRGTTFRIYLPCVSSAPPAEAEQAPANASASDGRTILLVEDEKSLLKLNKRLLEHLGYTVLPASAPDEAMGIVRQRGGEIDLMMTDVIMPRMSGRELWDQVRRMYPEMRCLFTSGYTANVIAHHNVLDEGVHFLQKPFTAADLKEKIGEVLESPVE